jgi:hypothetical protein
MQSSVSKFLLNAKNKKKLSQKVSQVQLNHLNKKKLLFISSTIHVLPPQLVLNFSVFPLAGFRTFTGEVTDSAASVTASVGRHAPVAEVLGLEEILLKR